MILFDGSYFPVVIQVWSGEISDKDLQDYFTQHDALIRRAVDDRQKYVTVAVGSESLTPAHRRRISAWINDMPHEWHATSLGSFVVIKSAAARGLFTALKWLSPQMRSVTPVADRKEAVERAIQCLQRAGLQAPGGLRDWPSAHA